ncbi:MAG: hypothetical protein QMD95_01830 [Candidatus Hodarchaeaceae archaeon]|nr:hypothetical protein [Candidatus Hodarchaeaceae archaeon]
MTRQFQKKLIKKATEWLETVVTLATAQIVAEITVKTIMVSVQGGHPSYLKGRDKWLSDLSSKYSIPFENLKQIAEKIEDECAPWVKVAREAD